MFRQVLALISELVQRDMFCTKRDLYYKAPQLFGSQAAVDNIIDNISCMLGVPRWGLNVLATSKVRLGLGIIKFFIFTTEKTCLLGNQPFLLEMVLETLERASVRCSLAHCSKLEVIL